MEVNNEKKRTKLCARAHLPRFGSVQQSRKSWKLSRSPNEDEDMVVGHSADPHVIVEVVRGELRLRNVAPKSAADKNIYIKGGRKGENGGWNGHEPGERLDPFVDVARTLMLRRENSCLVDIQNVPRGSAAMGGDEYGRASRGRERKRCWGHVGGAQQGDRSKAAARWANGRVGQSGNKA